MENLVGKKFKSYYKMNDGSDFICGPYEIVKVSKTRISYTDGKARWAGERRQSIEWMGIKGFLNRIESGECKYC